MENRGICAHPASRAHSPFVPRGAERPASRRAAGLAVLLLLLATSGQVLGQDSVTLAGRVVDSLRAGIPYATLGVYTSDSALLGGTVCNESGHFRVALAQQPNYLMIVQPDRYVERFARTGVQRLTVHYEACDHLHRTLQHIHAQGMKAGVAINPHTPLNSCSTS